MADDSLLDVAYPPELRTAERELRGRPPVVGIAVSGGGIRSATFALGVFQALARLNVLRHIDCLSTVSGGSYFGAFLGRLFHRDYIQSTDDVRWVLTGPHNGEAPPRPDPTLERAGWKVVDWLRENGRYLSPRGAGDLLIGGAVLLRNWVSVHVVLASFFLTTFLILQLPRMAVAWWHDRLPRIVDVAGVVGAVGTALAWLPFSSVIQWTPWMLVALVVALVAVVPGWAYWIVRDNESFEPGALLGVAAAAIFGLLLAILARPDSWPSWMRTRSEPSPIAASLGLLVLVLAVLTGACFGVASWRAQHPFDPAKAPTNPAERTNAIRHSLSAGFKNVLIVAGILTAFAIIDTLGQTLYRWQSTGRPNWLAGTGALIVGAAGFARQIVVLIGPRSNGKRAPLPFVVIATIIAILLAVIILATLNATTHAIAWDFGQHGARADARIFLTWLAGFAFVALGVGRAFSFLNHSSYQPLYEARLTRAYLGASNDRRWTGLTKPVTEPIRGDDLEAHKYWPLERHSAADGGAKSVYEKGAPLHFVNVTINETFDGESQVQQQDRKGVNMALGPAGISAGIRHHVIFGRLLTPTNPDEQPTPEISHIFPQASGALAPFRAFDFGTPPIKFPGERLSLGQWVGISGAAFSTGTGFRTSLGLSLLAGIGNVRLGYWWAAGITRNRGAGALAALKRWQRLAYTVQRFMLSEFVARFPGTSHSNWYLSDGGHFENLGGYELIRRRLPLIIVIDAEEDADYTFEALANLIRKARLDFQTEITFVDRPPRGLAGSPQYTALFGSLEDLRPKQSDGSSKTDPGHLGRAKACCALARIQYPDEGATTGVTSEGWLLFIKPTLTGDEPLDVLQYARAHRPFPQQSTGDQFFDEAQWESYRKLGEHIASAIFDAPPSEPSELPGRTRWTLQDYGLVPER